jgi:hypothetical protein
MQPQPSHGLTYMSTDKEIKEVYFPKNAIAFPVRTCSICEATLNYLCSNMVLYYDSSCDCTSMSQPITHSWTELLRHEAPNG